MSTPFISRCANCVLRRSGAFSSNTDREIAFIQNFKHREMDVEAASLLSREGATTGELYTLLSGWAFRFRTLTNGKRQILNFLLPGDFIGLQEKLDAGCQNGVEMLTDGRVCCFPMGKIWDLYRDHPNLSYDLTWLAAHEELILDENLVSVGQRTAMQRIAMLLIHLHKRAGSVGMRDVNGAVPFPVSQQHMADALGLSLVHTNKTLRRLAHAGLHVIKNGRLTLLKPDVMSRVADYYALPARMRPLI